jgi:recombination protein RecT
MANIEQFKGADAPKAKSLTELMTSMAPQFKLALPLHLKENADRYMRLALTEMRRTPALAKCDPYSVMGAAMVATQLGLEPGPLGRAYLIPYGSECTFVPGWKGLVELTSRSGRAFSWSGVLFEGQGHIYEQGDSPILKVTEDSDEDDPDKIAYFWAVGRIKGQDYPVIERWSKAKMIKHRDRFNKVGKRHYSFQHWEMYGRKIPLLQVIKYLPATPELECAHMLDIQAERGRGLNIHTAADAIEGVFEPVDDQAPPNAAPPVSGNREAQDNESPVGQSGGAAPTYATVMHALHEASSPEALDAAADLIRSVPDKKHRDELTAAYKELRSPV